MKYKIYNIQETNHGNYPFLGTVVQPLCIITDLPLTQEGQQSLEKLIKASGFQSLSQICFLNKETIHLVDFFPALISADNIKLVWAFGLSPGLCGLPDHTPLRRAFHLRHQQWMFWPSYDTLIKNDMTKRDLWNEIKDMIIQL
jgi:hypothetical protein